MVVHGGVLILTDDEDLLRVFLAVVGSEFVMSVAHRKNHQSDFVKIAGPEVGDVPAELALADLIALGALVLPLR